MRIVFHNISTYLPEQYVNCLDILTVIGTFALAIVAIWSLRENIKARKAFIQPNIVVDFDVSSQLYLQLIVKNIGNNSAYNVNIKISPEINHPFSHIELLSSGKEYRHTVSEIENLSTIAAKYEISIEYVDLYHKRHSIPSFSLDLSTIKDTYKDKEDAPEEKLKNEVRYLADKIFAAMLNRKI